MAVNFLAFTMIPGDVSLIYTTYTPSHMGNDNQTHHTTNASTGVNLLMDTKKV